MQRKMLDHENLNNNQLVEIERLESQVKELTTKLNELTAQFRDRQSVLETQLQNANFEKNRLKEAIEGDHDFE